MTQRHAYKHYNFYVLTECVALAGMRATQTGLPSIHTVDRGGDRTRDYISQTIGRGEVNQPSKIL